MPPVQPVAESLAGLGHVDGVAVEEPPQLRLAHTLRLPSPAFPLGDVAGDDRLEDRIDVREEVRRRGGRGLGSHRGVGGKVRQQVQPVLRDDRMPDPVGPQEHLDRHPVAADVDCPRERLRGRRGRPRIGPGADHAREERQMRSGGSGQALMQLVGRFGELRQLAQQCFVDAAAQVVQLGQRLGRDHDDQLSSGVGERDRMRHPSSLGAELGVEHRFRSAALRVGTWRDPVRPVTLRHAFFQGPTAGRADAAMTTVSDIAGLNPGGDR
jgi:hypothetical protein